MPMIYVTATIEIPCNSEQAARVVADRNSGGFGTAERRAIEKDEKEGLPATAAKLDSGMKGWKSVSDDVAFGVGWRGEAPHFWYQKRYFKSV